MRIVLILLTAAALAACQSTKPRPVAPAARLIEVPVKVYVPIPAELTNPHPIATGPLRDVLEVGRKRRTELEQCNADKAAIRKIQGQPVP